MTRNLETENKVQSFYDGSGWASSAEEGHTTDAALWEDLRAVASPYVTACRKKLLQFIPASGSKMLDAASGPLQYPEYLEYSAQFDQRTCVDISAKALAIAKEKLGARGETVQSSILELPFGDNTFDCSLSLHTIYHIHRDQQEAAVRQLIRVTKPNQPLLIVYSNPDRLASWIKHKILRRPPHVAEDGVIYFFSHPLQWWQRFRDHCEVEITCWRSLTAQDSKRLIPDSELGKSLLAIVLWLENTFPGIAARWGAYPLIVLKKRT